MWWIQNIQSIHAYQLCWCHIMALHSLWWFQKWTKACSRQSYCSEEALACKWNRNLQQNLRSIKANLAYNHNFITGAITRKIWLVERIKLLKLWYAKFGGRSTFSIVFGSTKWSFGMAHFRKIGTQLFSRKIEKQFFWVRYLLNGDAVGG